jgi:hypothetical protein
MNFSQYIKNMQNIKHGDKTYEQRILMKINFESYVAHKKLIEQQKQQKYMLSTLTLMNMMHELK